MAVHRDLFEDGRDRKEDQREESTTSRAKSKIRRVPGEIVLEPMGSGVRVTARDKANRILWGYVGSKETLSKIHCLVAVYETLQGLLAEELEKHGLPSRETKEPMTAATEAIDRIEKTVRWLRDSLDVRAVKNATLERAQEIARIASDADRLMTVEASSLKGMRTRHVVG